MTKRSPLFILAVVATYIFLFVFIIAMIWGAVYAAMSVYILFVEGLSAAVPYFFMGIGLIIGGYLINVLLTFVLTKKWQWRITNRYEFREVPKKAKK